MSNPYYNIAAKLRIYQQFQNDNLIEKTECYISATSLSQIWYNSDGFNSFKLS